jgi:hypothetical protein
VDAVFCTLSTLDAAVSDDWLEGLDKHHPRIPILITSRAAAQARDPPSSAGCIDKPYRLADIVRHLESLLKDRDVQ